jgi:hypothetical protein
MSGYFDALMRSSGMTIGRPKRAPTQLEPAAIGGDVDRSTTSADENAVRSASTPHAPLHTADAVEPPMPPRVLGSVDRHAYQEPDTAATPAHGAAEAAVQPPKKPSATPVESLTPDLGHTLVRAALRWVAAGTHPDRPASAVKDVAQGVPRPPQSSPAVHEQNSTIATKRLHRDDDHAQPESRNGARAAPVLLNVAAEESVAAKPLPIRASLVAPAPLPPVAPPVRDEVVEVSIGAIHVRVDAPPAQTAARPAAPPVATQRAASTAPPRSALSRRALRRI